MMIVNVDNHTTSSTGQVISQNLYPAYLWVWSKQEKYITDFKIFTRPTA